MNSTTKAAAKVAEELNQWNVNSDTKQKGIPHTKARLEESLQKKMGKQIMHGHCIRRTDSSLMKKTWSHGCHWDIWKVKQSEIKAAKQHISHYYKISCNKNTTNRNRWQVQNMSTIWCGSRTHNISMPNTSKQTISRHDSVCGQLHFNLCKEMG
jgi:hypothetical protein